VHAKTHARTNSSHEISKSSFKAIEIYPSHEQGLPKKHVVLTHINQRPEAEANSEVKRTVGRRRAATSNGKSDHSIEHCYFAASKSAVSSYTLPRSIP
jgi:hypothetical protein